MDEALNKALNAPDINDTLLSAVEHADATMRRYIWRGFKPNFPAAKGELIVDGQSAGDFVNEALRRLCAGKRSYNPNRTLLENLNSITDSIISSDKKSSDRTPVIDFAPIENAEECPDPITAAKDAVPDAAALLVKNEDCAFQTECFAQIRESFDGDKETQHYLDSLAAGFFDINEISELTGIPVAKIYEIRKKLKKFANRLFGITKYSDLQRKIQAPTNESERQPAS